MTAGQRRVRASILVIVGIVYCALTAASIVTKLPWVDEAYFAGPALTLITKGYLGTSVIETAPGTPWIGIERHTYWMVPLHFLAQAGWYELFGFGLFSMRAQSLLWGLLALACWYVTVRRLTQHAGVALLAFVFIGVDSVLIATASSGRIDMMSAALGSAALAVYLRLREHSLTWAIFASQCLVVASGLTHPNGILYLATTAFVAISLDRARLRWRHAALGLMPYVLGGLAWGLYILQDPQLFWQQFGVNMTDGSRLSHLSKPWIGIEREIVDKYLTYFGLESGGLSRLKLLLPATYAAAIIYTVATPRLRRQRGYRILLILVALPFTLLSIYDGQKQPYYLIHTFPMIDALLAAAVIACLSTRSRWRSIVALVAAGFVALQVGTTVHRITRNPYQRSYLPVVTFLTQHSSPHTVIMGSAALNFGLGFDSGLIDDQRLGYHSGKTPDLVVVGDVDYRQYFESMRAKEPLVYRHVVTRLATEYRLVYDQAGYRVYAR